MFQHIKTSIRKAISTKSRRALTALLSAVFSVLCVSPAFAALPSVEKPSRNKGDSGIFETLQNYAYDAGVFIGLLIAAIGFLAVAWHGITVFSEVQNGKKRWGDFGAVVAVGVILLVVVIWLLTKAAEIL